MEELKKLVSNNEKRISIQEGIAKRIEETFKEFADEFRTFSRDLRKETASREYVDGKFLALELQIKNLKDCVKGEEKDNAWIRDQLWGIAKFIIFAVIGAGLTLVLKGDVHI